MPEREGRVVHRAFVWAAVMLIIVSGAACTNGPAKRESTTGSSRPVTSGVWNIDVAKLPAENAGSVQNLAQQVSFAWQEGSSLFLAAPSVILGSTDGVSWIERLAPPGRDNQSGQGRWQFGDEVSTGTRMVVVGSITTPPSASSGQGSPSIELDNGQRPAVWWSSDLGQTWQSGSSDAFAVAGGISSVAKTARGLVAVGVHRPKGAVGPFTPALWSSADEGSTWSEAKLPDATFMDSSASASGASLSDVVAFGEKVVVSGERGYRGAVWASTDLVQWEEVTGDVRSPVRLASRPGRVVAIAAYTSSGSSRDPSPPGWVTSDLRQWLPIAHDPQVFGDSTDAGPYRSSGGSHFAVTMWKERFVLRGSVPTRSNPQFCFQDLATCQQTTDFVAMSDDGLVWKRVAAEDRGQTGESTSFVSFIHNSEPMAVLAQRLIPASPVSDSEARSSRYREPTRQLQLWRWSVREDQPPPIAVAIPTTTAPPLRVIDPIQPELAVGASARMQWYTGGCGAGITISGTNYIPAAPGLPKAEPNWPVRQLNVADGPSMMVLVTVTRPKEDEVIIRVEGTDVSVRFVPGQSRGCS